MSKVLIVSRKAERCGIAQYGKRVSNILKKSTVHTYVHEYIESGFDLLMYFDEHQPDVVIYNYYAPLFPWLIDDFLHAHNLRARAKHGVLYHELWLDFKPDFIITNDSTAEDDLSNRFELYFSTPRPLFEDLDFLTQEEKTSNIPVIGTFGFGFKDKNYDKLATMVCTQFEEAILRLHVPFAEFGDNDGGLSQSAYAECSSIIATHNPKIKLEYNNTFLSDEELLKFLHSNDINVFLYSYYGNRGLSSTIDYVLSVRKPIAISDSEQFRHINQYVENAYRLPLPEILKLGTGRYGPIYEFHSNENFINKYNKIITTVL